MGAERGRVEQPAATPLTCLGAAALSDLRLSGPHVRHREWSVAIHIPDAGWIATAASPPRNDAADVAPDSDPQLSPSASPPATRGSLRTFGCVVSPSPSAHCTMMLSLQWPNL